MYERAHLLMRMSKNFLALLIAALLSSAAPAHAIEIPVWYQQPDLLTWGHQFIITAKLRGRDYTYWVMKWGNLVDK